MLKQISIFAENKKGTMGKITGLLAEKQINIWGSVTNDSAEYGIVRMIVSEPERALEALRGAGYLAKFTDVLGVEVEDKVGELNRLLRMITESNINVDYLYLSFNRESGKPVMILSVEETWETEDCLRAKGFCLV